MTGTDPSEAGVGIRRVVTTAIVTGTVGTLISAWVGGMIMGRSVAIGAALAIVNLLLLAQMVRAFVGRRSSAAPWALVAVFKFALLFGAMYVLVKTRVVDVLPCVLGFGLLPVSIVVAEWFGLWRTRGES
jgi:hypothetical protein